ncbi:MAG: hypothetical protein OQJ89_00335, partial [Kangiellaceae bacterium]|nr:hypothetical protein [Kangiellaceae bacterium]
MRKSFNKNKLNMAMSGVLVLATGSLSFAQPVYAAEQEEEESEKIVITGSRIQRSSAQMTTPTTVIGAAEIERTGATNLGEILHNLPASLDGIGATSINDNGTGSIDQAGMEF